MCLGGSLLSVVEIFFVIVNAALESKFKSNGKERELTVEEDETVNRSLKWSKRGKIRKRRDVYDNRYLSALKEIESNWKPIKLYDV